MVIDPRFTPHDPIELTRTCIEGGATAVQLRSRKLTDRESLELAQAMRSLTRIADALFFINDRVDLALAVQADGVHLGVDDLPLADARSIGGPDLLIGYSPETDDHTAGARSLGADYLGVGPVFGTSSKQDAGPAIGLECLRNRVRLARIPVIGIGGITAENALSVIAAGTCGVAVMSSIIASDDPGSETRLINAAMGFPGSL